MEKSELWVYKGSGPEEAPEPAAGNKDGKDVSFGLYNNYQCLILKSKSVILHLVAGTLWFCKWALQCGGTWYW